MAERRLEETKQCLAAALLVSALALLFLTGAAPAPAAERSATGAEADCGNRVMTARGCRSREAAARDLEQILRDARADYGLKAAIMRIDTGRRTLVRTAIGRSQADVAARPRMSFRIGSMAIPWLTSIVLQLRDEGRLDLDDRISRWLPNPPRADEVTVRMLATNGSGYHDYIQGNQPFIDRLYVNPFRQWRPQELLDVAFGRGFACEPGACFNYAHTNYILLSRIVQRITGTSTARQMRRRVLGPLGLERTQLTAEANIRRPALHGFTSERGVYEDSTTWSPSWTIGSGTIATSTIDDITVAARSALSGRLLSPRSRRTFVAPATPGSPYFAFGLIVGGDWRLQNPQLNGYSGVQGYLPRERLSVAVMTTNRKAASKDETNFSEETFARLADYVAPEHPTPWTGGD